MNNTPIRTLTILILAFLAACGSAQQGTAPTVNPSITTPTFFLFYTDG